MKRVIRKIRPTLDSDYNIDEFNLDEQLSDSESEEKKFRTNCTKKY